MVLAQVLNITVQPGTVPCCAAHSQLSSASAQLFSPAQCISVVQCSAQCAVSAVGWLLATSLSTCAYFVARVQVLPGLVSGVSHAGSSTFAAPWHWNATLRLHNCNLILPARLVPVNCIVATHARHFVCIDTAPYALPCPALASHRTGQHTIGERG